MFSKEFIEDVIDSFIELLSYNILVAAIKENHPNKINMVKK
jgi:uncharacterized short protein YbdD (DUF466 family)